MSLVDVHSRVLICHLQRRHKLRYQVHYKIEHYASKHHAGRIFHRLLCSGSPVLLIHVEVSYGACVFHLALFYLTHTLKKLPTSNSGRKSLKKHWLRTIKTPTLILTGRKMPLQIKRNCFPICTWWKPFENNTKQKVKNRKTNEKWNGTKIECKLTDNVTIKDSIP